MWLDLRRVNSAPRYMIIDTDLNIVTIAARFPSSGELQKLF